MVKNSQNFFDGEKYISSKQAAELANYTSDYIGQLCRGGKIKARRIGRDWFVSEENLLEYQDKLAGITREVSIKINKEPTSFEIGSSGNEFQQKKEQTDYELITISHEPTTVDDIYSFDISVDNTKDKHFKELFKHKNYESRTIDYKLEANSRISRENEPLQNKIYFEASKNKIKKINIFLSVWKTLASVSAFGLITIVKINHALANWIEDRRYQKIKKQELKTKNYGFKIDSRQSRLGDLSKFLRILALVVR